MIAFPLIATVLALGCAGFVGWDALRRPRPERIAWAVAFQLFAVAAGAEVAGAALGWTPLLARLYYLTGAVLVVGLLALGELYLLAPGRMPAATPGLTILVVAVAITTVWSAPIGAAALQIQGWDAIERGPFLVALAASINAGGTLVLVAGTLYSAWTLRGVGGLRSRAAGCFLIAIGAVVVAAGGTLTRFGHREYLYLAMSLGISIIFGGVLLTRLAPGARIGGSRPGVVSTGEREARLIALPAPVRPATTRGDAGLRFIAEQVLSLDDSEIAIVCRRWSARNIESDVLTREQAGQVWSLRLALPSETTARFDRLPLSVQAQLAELFIEVWSAETAGIGAQHA